MRINETRNVARLLQGMGGTDDYTELTNKPQINGTELTGNKTSEELGIEGRSSIVAKMNTILANLESGTGITDTEDVALLDDIISGNVSVFVLECNDSENDRHDYYYITGVSPDIISFTNLDTSYEFDYVDDHWEFAVA